MNETQIQNTPAEISLIDLWIVIVRGAKWLVGVPIAAGVFAVAATYLIQPRFTSTVQIMTPQQPQSGAAALLGAIGGLAGVGDSALGALKNPADQWIGLLKSRTIADQLVAKFDLQKRYEKDYMFRTREELAKRTNIQVGKDSLIGIAVEDTDPKMAAAMAAAYVKGLEVLSKHLAVTAASQRRLLFEQQMRDAKEKLDKAQVALGDSGIGLSTVKTSPEAAVGALADLQAQIAASEVRLNVVRSSLREGSAEVRQAQAELSSLRAQLKTIEQTSTAGPADPGNSYVERYRSFKYYAKLYEILSQQYEIARSDEASEGAVVQVVDPAQVPEWKSSPKRALIGLLTAISAFVLTVFWLFARQAYVNLKTDPVAAAKLATLR
jgi:uncharacterized protein involved in exopolysaccharide biosynthesis